MKEVNLADYGRSILHYLSRKREGLTLDFEVRRSILLISLLHTNVKNSIKIK